MHQVYVDKKEYKIFVISDIHGDLPLFKKLLAKLNITPSDYLVLLGDYVNKGDYGVETLDYVKELEKRKNTYVLKGNHELAMYDMFTNKMDFLEMYQWIIVNKKNLVNDILSPEGKCISDFTKDELFDYLSTKKHIIEKINSLITVLHFDDFIFVHGGYEKNIAKEEEYKYLKWDTFNEDSVVNDKTVVVGHMPVVNFRVDHIDTRPYFNHEKNIIFIDGGVGVNLVSELNALIIEKTNGKTTYQFVQENNFSVKKVKKTIRLDKDSESVFVNYPFFEVEIIEKGNPFSICKYKRTDKCFSIFTSMLDGDRVTYNYTNNFLSVAKGEEVQLCYYYEDYALVKYKNEFGWIKKESIL